VIDLMMEAVSTSEMSVHFYQTAQRYIPEDGHVKNVFCIYRQIVELQKILYKWLTLWLF
jgi:hypothetical protein